MPDHILVSEIFGPTIQGEGALAGQVSHFLRTFGCPYRCAWCDSMHAVDPKNSVNAERLTVDDICSRLQALPPARWLTLSGGDPVAWDLSELVSACQPTFRIAVETQGSLWHDWLESCHLVTCSPKPPSSGMADRLDIALLQKYHVRLGGRLVFKIVVFDNQDLEFAARITKRLPEIRLFLSSGTELNDPSIRLAVLSKYKWLAERVIQYPELRHATVLPQLHTLLWGRELGR